MAPYPEWAPIVISIGIATGVGILTGIFVAFYVVPRQKSSILMTFTLLEETHEKERLLDNEKKQAEGQEGGEQEQHDQPDR